MYLKIEKRRKWEKLPGARYFATFTSLRALPHQFLLIISYCVANFILGSSSVAVFLIHKKQKLTKSSFFNL
jgi:hypothetical protein